MEKLQRFLSRAGLASRRSAAEIIEAGRVEVDGEKVTDVTATIEPARSVVKVDGRKVRPQPLVYFMLHKPAGYICTQKPREGERSILELLQGVTQRLFSVGRLDRESEGLLLLTNDGDLTNILTHPRFNVPKTYRVEAVGRLGSDQLDKLQHGMWFEGRKTRPARILIHSRAATRSVLDITITEGLNREVRRMLARVGLKVRHLKRIRIGRLSLRGVGKGRFRPLTGEELRYLRSLAERLAAAPAGKE